MLGSAATVRARRSPARPALTGQGRGCRCPPVRAQRPRPRHPRRCPAVDLRPLHRGWARRRGSPRRHRRRCRRSPALVGRNRRRCTRARVARRHRRRWYRRAGRGSRLLLLMGLRAAMRRRLRRSAGRVCLRALAGRPPGPPPRARARRLLRLPARRVESDRACPRLRPSWGVRRARRRLRLAPARRLGTPRRRPWAGSGRRLRCPVVGRRRRCLVRRRSRARRWRAARCRLRPWAGRGACARRTWGVGRSSRTVRCRRPRRRWVGRRRWVDRVVTDRRLRRRWAGRRPRRPMARRRLRRPLRPPRRR